VAESFFALSKKDQREALEYDRAETGRPGAPDLRMVNAACGTLCSMSVSLLDCVFLHQTSGRHPMRIAPMAMSNCPSQPQLTEHLPWPSQSGQG